MFKTADVAIREFDTQLIQMVAVLSFKIPQKSFDCSDHSRWTNVIPMVGNESLFVVFNVEH